LHGENERWGKQKRKELKRVKNMMQGRVQRWGECGTFTIW
jgi:hypothetical protein